MHVASNGWSARLYWLWILYNSVAFVVVLTAVAVLSWISADVLHLSLSSRSWVVALLVATAGALLFGGVLGALQWLDALDFTRNDGSVAQVYLMLIATTPLTGRMLLLVLAPSAALSQEPATT